MARSGGGGGVVRAVAILVVSTLAVLRSPTLTLSLPLLTDDVGLSPDFHAASCPQLENIVRSAVQAALQREIALAAGLLRIFFHDCFPQSGGQPDSFAPAPRDAVFQFPDSTSNVSTLINVFQSRNLDAVDLVALSGGHTIGRSHCSSFSNRFAEDDDFKRRLTANCSSDGNRLQDLDVTTPDVFDNKYYNNLVAGHGVFTSDQGLTGDSNTSWVVNGFAGNHSWFFGQFGTSMAKLGQIQGPAGNVGEIRRNSCFVPNGQSIIAAASDEGFAAST